MWFCSVRELAIVETRSRTVQRPASVFPVYTVEEWKFSGDITIKLLSYVDNCSNPVLKMYFKALKWWADQQIQFLEPKCTFKCSLKPTFDPILGHSRPWYSVGSTLVLSVYLHLGVTSAFCFWGVLCILSWSPLSACYISRPFFSLIYWAE